ncbi:MAG: diguanylate cyclase [Planctomycetes bacterium]|nr:diguanylate cyclase [Planctomycetota bacterium]
MMHQYVTAITILNVFVANTLIGYVVWQLWESRVAQRHNQSEPSQTDTPACANVAPDQQDAETAEQEPEGLVAEENTDSPEPEEPLVSAEFAACAEVLKLRVDDYLQQLIEVEQRARTGDETPEQLMPDLCNFNQSWLSQLEEVCTSLLDNMDSMNEIEAALEEVVLNVTAQTETSCNNLTNHKFSGELSTDRRFLLDEIFRLIRSAHDLRDVTAETLFKAGRHHEDSEAKSTEQQLAYRKITELVDRWRKESEDASLSVAYLDVDRLTTVNQRHGTRVADQIVDHLRDLIDEVLQDAGEKATVVRLGGAKYIAFLEDSDYTGAVHAMETIRQNTEAATFKTATDDVTLTISASVISDPHEEPATVLLPRLQDLLSGTKPSGGNRIVKETNSKPALVEPLKVFVVPRVISVSSSAN